MASERLRDLGKLAAQTRKRLDEEFPKTDIKLSNAFVIALIFDTCDQDDFDD